MQKIIDDHPGATLSRRDFVAGAAAAGAAIVVTAPLGVAFTSGRDDVADIVRLMERAFYFPKIGLQNERVYAIGFDLPAAGGHPAGVVDQEVWERWNSYSLSSVSDERFDVMANYLKETGRLWKYAEGGVSYTYEL